MEKESDETQSVMNAKENLERLERKMKLIQSAASILICPNPSWGTPCACRRC